MSLNGNGRRRTICIITGDISGDQNAGRLANAIRSLAPDIRLVGAGGQAMVEAGVEVPIRSTHVSLVGMPDSLSILPALIRVYRELRRLIDESEPDLVVLIDNESMNMMLAKRLRQKGVPVVFFFPPQVWFWGRWRLRMVVPRARRVLCAFREEAELYRAAGADTVWVGHPLLDVVKVNEDTDKAIREIGLDPARPIVAVLPGSRRQEVQALGRIMVGAAKLLQHRDPAIQFAIPLASESLRAVIEPGVAQSGLKDVALYRPRSYAVLSRAKVALQCSGTATVETGLLGIPSVITYRCNPLAYFVSGFVKKVDYIGMVNILLGEMVQPEFFQKNVDPEHLADAVWSLLTDEDRRRRIKLRLFALADILGPAGASNRAAQALLELLEGGSNVSATVLDNEPEHDYEYVAHSGSVAASR